MSSDCNTENPSLVIGEGGGKLPPVLTVEDNDGIRRLIYRIKQELRLLEVKKTDTLRRINALTKTIEALVWLVGPDKIELDLKSIGLSSTEESHRVSRGLTKWCRKVLSESTEPLSIREIVDHIQARGPAVFAKCQNPSNAVRSVLRRLVNYSEVVETTKSGAIKGWMSKERGQRTGLAFLKSISDREFGDRADTL